MSANAIKIIRIELPVSKYTSMGWDSPYEVLVFG
jgi:hypothetical protein